MRIILYTGKGGVGKTSVAAATALKASRMGYKTIVVSTDAAHSLADSFDKPLGSEAVEVARNLWGQEPDIGDSIRQHWGTVQEWLSAIMAWRGMKGMIAEEMAVLPGMEELTNLLYITDYYSRGIYDVIVVDCAPTGETLRLLSFPEVLHWWMEKLFPIERKAASLIRPLVKRLSDIPMPEDKVFAAAEDLFNQIEKMRQLLTDKKLSSVRLVVNPEKMVIKEAQRTYTYLNLYGYHTDLIVCNRVIPAEVKDVYFDSWKEIQKRHRQTIEEAFAPVPILDVPLFGKEVVGLKMLQGMGEAIFGDGDPTGIFFEGKAHEIEKRDGHYILVLDLPFTSREEISVFQAGDELVVQVGKYKRNIILPRSMVGMSVVEAIFTDHRLNIKFEHKPPHTGEAGEAVKPAARTRTRTQEGKK
ncbi:MAG: ArsA family ATPase [Chloroflexi bacterium]|nr:ArsA family ATPase [Chloroflexota bacterium]